MSIRAGTFRNLLSDILKRRLAEPMFILVRGDVNDDWKAPVSFTIIKRGNRRHISPQSTLAIFQVRKCRGVLDLESPAVNNAL